MKLKHESDQVISEKNSESKLEAVKIDSGRFLVIGGISNTMLREGYGLKTKEVNGKSELTVNPEELQYLINKNHIRQNNSYTGPEVNLTLLSFYVHMKS